jgi:hypothetical protein
MKSPFCLLQMQTEMRTMLRVRIPLLSVALALGAIGSAHAGWHEFWDRFHLDFHRNNCWMEPFRSVDRQAARMPFQAMVASGWQTQNTLSSHYFHPETHALNEAGERRIYWIMTHAPEEHRTLYVSQAYVPGVARAPHGQRATITGTHVARSTVARCDRRL